MKGCLVNLPACIIDVKLCIQESGGSTILTNTKLSNTFFGDTLCSYRKLDFLQNFEQIYSIQFAKVITFYSQ